MLQIFLSIIFWYKTWVANRKFRLFQKFRDVLFRDNFVTARANKEGSFDHLSFLITLFFKNTDSFLRLSELLLLHNNTDRLIFLLVVIIFAGKYHRIKLRNHDSTLCNRSKFSPCQFIDKMTKSIVIFFFSFGLLNGELKLTLNFAHKKIVDHNIIGRFIKFVFDSDEFKFALHGLIPIKYVHCFKDVDESWLIAFVVGSNQIADPKNN